jgi:hypothetical protein
VYVVFVLCRTRVVGKFVSGVDKMGSNCNRYVG